MTSPDRALTYSTYLKVDELLDLQQPRSEGQEHDELLFIVIHQTYELWFRSLLHELERTQRLLESGETYASLAALGRVRTIFKVLVSQVDILETMTPLQFNSFRDRLDQASGFQSGQFRELEAVFGRRDESVLKPFANHPRVHARLVDALSRESLWDSTLRYLHDRGHAVPPAVLERSFAEQYVSTPEVTQVVADAYRNDQEAALVLERLLDIDEGLQEWRYRHVKMVERTIGSKVGTGGSSGAQYLASTLFRPVFADLWNARQLF
jgi:tryptophan 2,3-dioxygenase